MESFIGRPSMVNMAYTCLAECPQIIKFDFGHFGPQLCDILQADIVYGSVQQIRQKSMKWHHVHK